MDNDDFLTRREAVRYLRSIGLITSVESLAKWGHNNNAGKGPPFTSRGKGAPVAYQKSHLYNWAQTKLKLIK